MDKQVMKFLSEKIGIELKVRNYDNMIDETIEMRSKRLEKIERVARGFSESSEMNTTEAMEEFYRNARRKD